MTYKKEKLFLKPLLYRLRNSFFTNNERIQFGL